MPKHQHKEKSYKDPRFTTERVRELFAEVVEGPLRKALGALEGYAGLGSEWHRRQIEDIFGGWEAAPHWWRREPCGRGGRCGQCLGDEDPEFEDASRDRFWDRVRIYTGCGESYSLLAAVYKFRPPREARQILWALDSVRPQRLGVLEAQSLEAPLLAQLAKDLEDQAPMGKEARRALREAAARRHDRVAESLQGAAGIFDEEIGEAVGLPLGCQVACGRYAVEARGGDRRRAEAAAAALCGLVAGDPKGSGGLLAWCRRRFAEPGHLRALEAAAGADLEEV